MATTRQVVLTLAFRDATNRNFKFNGVEQSVLSSVKDKIKAINADMPPYFAHTFVSDIGAECIMISAAEIITTEEEVIYNAS